MKRILFILAIAAILMMIAPASAVIDIRVKERTSSFITWEWDSGLSLKNASIDGYIIKLFDPLSTEFTLSDLPANESHTFALYTETDSGVKTSRTLKDTSNYSSVMDVINTWIYLLFIIALIWAGVKLSKWFFWLASFISLYALAKFILESESIMTDILHLPFFVYGAMFIIPILMFFFSKGRR